MDKQFIGDLKNTAKQVGAVTLGLAAVGLATDVALAYTGHPSDAGFRTGAGAGRFMSQPPVRPTPPGMMHEMPPMKPWP
jgi:hypothetical protein